MNGIFRKLASNDQVSKASCELENLYSRSYLTVARVTIMHKSVYKLLMGQNIVHDKKIATCPGKQGST